MTYQQAIKYLNSFIDYEKLNNYAYNKAFGLERVKALLNALGNPQDELRCIHVAGTKGKGSTCAFIAYALREAGYRVGLYTSPHLSDFRERIRILIKAKKVPGTKKGARHLFEGMISKQDLTRLVEIMGTPLKEVSPPLPTFFEVYTALAFLYFKEKKVDFAVLETGLGGRLDATNVVNPLVCVITPISLEHTQYLGSTLKKIAIEKAGIIKAVGKGARHQKRCQAPFPIVITAPQKKEVLEVIRKRCKETGARLYEVKSYKKRKLRLLGEHQLMNAEVAANVVKGLCSRKDIENGLKNTIWPGRCEVVRRRPLVVLDGAQNIASVQALKKAIKDNFRYKKLVLIFGASADKDIKGMAKELRGFADEIVLTKSTNPRAANPKNLERYFSGKKICITSDTKEAAAKAGAVARKDDLVLVTGSLFVVGEARQFYA